MTSFAALEATVTSTGLWDNGRRHGPHSFRLSPQPYQITAAQKAEIDDLSTSIHRCLLGVSRLMAIAADQALSGGVPAYNRLYRLLMRSTPYGMAAVRPATIPLLAKIDLMVGRDGRFYVAEIDATNPRSWGYSVIGRQICRTIDDCAVLYPGVAGYISRHLTRQRADQILFLYGHTQRFYAPEFAVIATELKELGITMAVADEVEITPPPAQTWLVDLPPMNQNKPLIDYLTTSYRERKVEFLVPPKHFLSSKSLLAILSSPDEATEHLLRSQIPGPDLDRLRSHLPATMLATEQHLAAGDQVVKRAVASGAKGVAFPDDPAYATHVAAASREPDHYVLQRPVEQKPHTWSVYDSPGALTTTPGWYVRLTAYASREGAKDLAVTLKQDPRVHGNPDAVVTGTVLT